MKPCLSCVLAFGVWLSVSSPPAHAQQGQIRADGGIAIGGSVRYSTINNSTINNFGISQEKLDELVRERTRPLEELTAQQRENITLLKEKLDLNARQVRAALEIVGEANVPPERWLPNSLRSQNATKQLLATSAAQPGDSPNVAALKAGAQKAIDAGDLDKADALLADVEAEQRRDRDRQALNIAETSARRGEIALTRLRYAEAGTYFAKAAAVFSPNGAHEDKRIGYLEKEADALYQQGDELGDNGALLSAIERYKRLLALMPRERVPSDWATIQNNLGTALFTLGVRENGTAKLEEATAAFRAALSERTRERAPLLWADTQNNLANALADARRARERDDKARSGRRRPSPGLERKKPRARAARLGAVPSQSRHRARGARHARKQHGAPRRGRHSVSLGPRGIHPRARAAQAGRQRNLPSGAPSPRSARARAAARAWRKRWPPIAKP